MCGLAAILSLSGAPVARSDLARMASVLEHRGPDQAACAITAGGSVGVAHTRLSVVDIAGGQQPLFSEDGSLLLAYNGEIYDHDELRKELTARGARFRTRSDTEVILRLYEAYGLDALQRLNGEFAFLLYDGRLRRLFAVRDYAGIKPLYLQQTPTEVVFASECKAIFALGRSRRALAKDYLTGPLWGVFPDAYSAFEGVESVKPGHVLILDRGGRREERRYHHQVYAHDRVRSFEEAKSAVREAVQRAVQRRLVADVDAHVYLSGGLDSTIVCGEVAKAGRPFSAYSIAFPGSDYDESPRAERVARHFGAEFRRLDCRMEDLARELPRTMLHTESVVVNPGSVAKLLLSRLVRADGRRVCLTGEGADELFAGYPYFKLETLWRMLKRGGEDAKRANELMKRFRAMETRSEGIHWNRNAPWRRLEPLFGYPSFHQTRASEYGRLIPWLFETADLGIGPDDTPEGAFRRGFDLRRMRELHPMDASREVTFRQLYGYMIPNLADRVEMANSVECRTPFLDRDLLALAGTLPPEHLLDLDTLREKRVLHGAFCAELPDFQRDEHKHPFMSPDWGTLASTPSGRALFEDVLAPASIRDAGIFRPATVMGLRALFRALPKRTSVGRKLDTLMGIILGVQLLHRLFVARGVESDPTFPLAIRRPPERAPQAAAS